MSTIATNTAAKRGQRREFNGRLYQCMYPGDSINGGIWKEVVDGQVINHIPDYTICCQLDKFGTTV
jgi:hypothetical protein